MAIVQKAKENPLITTAIGIFTLAAGISGTWAAVGLIDELHTTEAELLLYDLKAHTFATQQFDALGVDILRLENVGKCRWLKSEIRALKDAIYVRERDGADPDYIFDLKGDLDELETDYAALGCQRLLA